jgi:predicted O-methyltransferase YrrM
VFHNIPPEIQAQMQKLEQMDARDREDGTPRLKRLRQIPPQTGKFLALLSANVPRGHILEIGASAGYSTLWLSLAARETDRKVVTFEILEEKAQLARATFKAARVEQVIELVVGDALDYLEAYQDIAFCFLDAEKEVYQACYDVIIPRMVQGGYLVADNAINHRHILQPMIDRALLDDRVDAMVAPIGKGLLICRKI